jgi:hypothetical protein
MIIPKHVGVGIYIYRNVKKQNQRIRLQRWVMQDPRMNHQLTMQDGWCVDNKTLFHWILVPYITTVISYVSTIHMYLLFTYLVATKCLAYLLTYIVGYPTYIPTCLPLGLI